MLLLNLLLFLFYQFLLVLKELRHNLNERHNIKSYNIYQLMV